MKSQLTYKPIYKMRIYRVYEKSIDRVSQATFGTLGILSYTKISNKTIKFKGRSTQVMRWILL